MPSKLVAGFMMAVVAVMFIASGAMAEKKLLCVSNQTLKGEETVATCLAKGDKFAVIDEYGIVHIMTPEEVALTKAFNPKIFQMRAYGEKYQKEAPIMPLPPSAEE